MKVTLDGINCCVREDVQSFIESSERNYSRQIEAVTEEIASHNGRTLVMLAGPSGSGKTTTALLLRKKLQLMGRNAITVSLDDFYCEDNLNYTFEDGTVDFETVKALDVDLIGECLSKLLKEGSCNLPRFNFKTKNRDKFTRTEIEKDGIIIVEGLHAINPVITDTVNTERMIKVYVSVSSRVLDGEAVLLTKRDLRFVRRLIRDYHHRNTEVEYTFYLWNGVRKGEDRYLFPFSDRADIRIDSIHPYEPCVFKDTALKLLEHIEESSEYFKEASELKNKLSGFVSLPESVIPAESLLNEFIE
ncbi:MAG: zeta toxin family protein [Clostridia bacterium]|nr:zeta toxin family protein [Clostridia bacterium]MBR2419046.1 zeta toxin family protein [Clostridia bacterium]